MIFNWIDAMIEQTIIQIQSNSLTISNVMDQTSEIAKKSSSEKLAFSQGTISHVTKHRNYTYSIGYTTDQIFLKADREYNFKPIPHVYILRLKKSHRFNRITADNSY